MTIYPVRRSVRSILWFIAAVLAVFLGAIAWYWFAFNPQTYDRW
jgi:hypothetical protein